MQPKNLFEHFATITEPRTHTNKNAHKLIDIIVLTIYAVLAKAGFRRGPGEPLQP